MANVICPGCGAAYAAAAVANVAMFRCARCGQVVAGGLASAAPPARAPSDGAPRRAARRPAAEPAKKGGVPPAAWIGGGVALVAVIVAVVVAAGGHGEPAAPSPAAATATAAAPAAPAPPKADPMKDAEAWKALAAAERESRAARYAEEADVTSAAGVSRAREFLSARGETAALASLATRVLDRGGDEAWAHAALGHADVGAEADQCLTHSELADDANDESFLELKRERAKHPGTWWADAAAAKKVRDTIAAVRAAETLLGTPYGQGVAHWISLQRATPVMRDNPALHAAFGPYVIFVSLNVPRDEKAPARDVTMADVPQEEIARGKAVLDRDVKLFSEYYDAWMEQIGARLGCTRYGPQNSDLKTLMKVNVFSKPEDFVAYNAKTGAGIGLFTRAYYSPMEPRYVVTYDGSGVKHGPDGEGEDAEYVDHVQCHEATHQLVHFYTWDLTRKDLGHDPDWLQVAWRPLWSGEGFAEFCSAFTVKDGKRVWMQPLENRMQEMWVFDEMVREKGWKDWKLQEFFGLTNGLELESFAKIRAKKNEDEIVATGVMSNLFYGEAWSFVYFLWYAEEDGKPKYRDRFVEYLKSEFHVRFVADPRTGEARPAPAWSGTFAQVMGLSTDAKWDALEKEWRAFTAKLVEAHRKPAWDVERTKMRRIFGFDKPPGK
jgi:hypothetical protein